MANGLERDIEYPEEELLPVQAPPSLFNRRPLPVQEQLVYDPATNQPVQAPARNTQILQGTIPAQVQPGMPIPISPAQLQQQDQALNIMFERAQNLAEAERAVNIALQFQRMRHMDQLTRSGVPPAQAFIESNMRYPSRDSAGMIRAVGPQQPVGTEELTLGGQPWLRNPRTGALYRNQPPATPPEVQPLDLSPGKYRMGNQVITVQEPRQPRVHPSQKALDDAKAELASARSSKYAKIKDIPALEAKVQSLEQAVGGAPSPTGGPAKLTVEQAKEFLRQSEGNKDKARQMAKDAGYTF